MTKRSIATSFALLLAISAVPVCRAADVNFITDGDFNDGVNWSDGNAPSLSLNNYFIQNGLTATYAGGTLSLRKLVVSDSSPGTLNMTGGDLSLAGGGDSFQIGRGCCGADGMVDLSGTAILRTTDNSSVGDRDKGVLHIGPAASVISPGAYWRVGNFGPSVDAGLEGNGLLDVEGKFSARDLFIGVQDGTGVMQIRGTGSVTLTPFGADPEADIVDFNHDPIFQPNQSGTIHMIGSKASLSARNLLFDHAAQVSKNVLWFTADAGGVSPITLTQAANIDNNALKVDLTDFALAPGKSIVLINAADGQLFGAFETLDVLGVANPSDYKVIYDLASGDISLKNTAVPEPSAAILLGLGGVLALGTRRRVSR